jgi:hypothetical protein
VVIIVFVFVFSLLQDILFSTGDRIKDIEKDFHSEMTLKPENILPMLTDLNRKSISLFFREGG